MLLILFVLMPSLLFAEEHAHPKNEIGVSPGVTYSPAHGEWGFGFHLHYFRTVSHNGRWAVGGSLENVTSKDSHYGVSVGASFRIVGGLRLAVMPGFSFVFDEMKGNYKPFYATHFELVYDALHVKNFHFGPVIDYSLSKDDSHAMLGVHIAYAF